MEVSLHTGLRLKSPHQRIAEAEAEAQKLSSSHDIFFLYRRFTYRITQSNPTLKTNSLASDGH